MSYYTKWTLNERAKKTAKKSSRIYTLNESVCNNSAHNISIVHVAVCVLRIGIVTNNTKATDQRHWLFLRWLRYKMHDRGNLQNIAYALKYLRPYCNSPHYHYHYHSIPIDWRIVSSFQWIWAYISLDRWNKSNENEMNHSHTDLSFQRTVQRNGTSDATSVYLVRSSQSEGQIKFSAIIRLKRCLLWDCASCSISEASFSVKQPLLLLLNLSPPTIYYIVNLVHSSS